MGAADTFRLQPGCQVSVAGTKLAIAEEARLVRIEVDLDVDLFGRCELVFHDPHMELISGSKFVSGTQVQVKLGFANQLQKVFEGEVVALEPHFVRDLPPALHVVCQESLHRLALSQMTRALNDVDDKQIATLIAQDHGLTAEAPSGTKEHQLQAGVTDALLLRRMAAKKGNVLRIEGKKLIIGPPPKGGEVRVGPGSMLKKLKVKISSNQQIGEVEVRGWDPKAKQEIVSRAKPQGETGEGARKYGKTSSLAIAGHGPQPVDTATAEAMAKGRLRKIAEGFVVASGEMVGDPRVVPGTVLAVEGLGAQIDGSYRVDHATHFFSRHGYLVKFKAVRTSRETRAKKAAVKALKDAEKQRQEEALENAIAPETAQIDVQVVSAGGEAVAERPFRIFLPDGKTLEGRTDKEGRVRKRTELKGNFQLILPDLEKGGGPKKNPAAKRGGTPTPSAGAGRLELQIVSATGAPQPALEAVVTLADGTERAGKTDAQGRFALEGLPGSGECKLDLPDVAGKVEAPAAERIGYSSGVAIPLGVAAVVEIPQRVRRCRMKGLHFETDKTFLQPTAMTGIRQLVRLYNSFEGMSVLVNGHSDRQGSGKPGIAEHNRGLSDERAESIKAFLTDKAEVWQKFYAGTKNSKPWGLREDQFMLATVKDSAGLPFYTGRIDGTPGPLSEEAYAKFQTANKLPVTRAANEKTRLELTRAYMAQDGTSLPKTAPIESHGCGMTHPTKGTEDDPKLDQPANRRVEVFLFEGEIKPKPVDPCPPKGCDEYKVWSDEKTLAADVDLDAPPGTLKARVVDEKGQPIAAAHVHASGPLSLDGNGAEVSFDDLIPGSYRVIADADGFLAEEDTKEVPAGGTGELTLTLKSERFDLEVRVEDESKPPKPIADALVTIDAPGAATAKTGREGLARFTGLPRGTFQLKADHPGFKQGAATVVLPRPRTSSAQARPPVSFADKAPSADAAPPDEPLVVPLAAEPVELQVLVLDADAKQRGQDVGVDGVTVSVDQLVSGKPKVETTKNGGIAKYDIGRGLTTGDCDITITKDGFATRKVTRTLVAASNSVPIEIKGALSVTVEAVDETGLAVTDLRIDLSGPSPRSQPTGNSNSRRFDDLQPGAYSALAFKPGFDTEPVKFAAGTVSKVTLRLHGRASLVVTVRDAQAKAPLAGSNAQVTLVPKAGGAAIGPKPVDGSGIAKFDEVLTDTYEVKATASFHRDGVAKPDARVQRTVANVAAVDLVHLVSMGFDVTDAVTKSKLGGALLRFSNGPEAHADATTKPNGVALVNDLVVGKYKLDVEHAGHDKLSMDLDANANDGGITKVPIALEPEVSLVVHVRGGVPLSDLVGAKVIVTPSGKPALPAVPSGGGGLAPFSGLEQILHGVHVEVPDHRIFDETTGPLKKGANTLPVDLKAINRAVVKVVDRLTRVPVVDAQVTLVAGGETHSSPTLAPTGGRAFPNVLAGPATVAVTRDPRYVASGQQNVTVQTADKGEQAIPIELTPILVPCTVHLIDKNTRGNIIGATLDLDPVPKGLTTHATADGSGEAHLDLPMGDWPAVCRAKGYDDLRVTLRVPDGSTHPKFEAELQRRVVIELLDANKAVLTELRFGLFDNAYDSTSPAADPPLINKLAEADNFVGADSRRFYIRTKDPASQGTARVQATWRTFAGGRFLLDEPSPSADITLLAVAPDSDVFESRGLMLVSDDADRDLVTHCGIDGLHANPLRARGDADHRVRRGSMFGTVEVEYPPKSSLLKSVPVFRNADKKRFDLQIFVLRTAPGAAGSLTVAAARVFFHLQKARELYERVGVFVATTTHPTAESKGDAKHTGGFADFFYEIDPFLAGPPPLTVNVNAPSQNDMLALARAYPQSPNLVRVFFALGPPAGSGGATFGGNPATAANPHLGCSFLFDSPRPFAMAHELGHALGYSTGPGGHFVFPTQPPNVRMANKWNLMDAAGPTPPNQNNRLWDVNDANGINQMSVMLGSTYLRPL